MWYIKELFSSKWRWNRSKFWLYPLPFFIWLTIFLILLSTINNNNLNYLLTILVPMCMLSLYYIAFTAYIKRLHDLDKSGWMSLLILIPFANIYIFVICGFFKWTVWENKYWPDPLGWTNIGWTNTKSKIPNEL